ncbi:TonB-dependent receptor [Pedobacter gandavensis]|uniref:TonB-dependent receptor n=1 Tax=Pedobacter gandavensis TaxID=2679963 RepID=UPI0029315C89|nr:TonB-dependent receptor [Pedobacter gandavensis]
MKSIFTLLFCLFCFAAQAQQLEISGQVVSNKKPVQGASVTLKPIAKEVKTDANGQFSFTGLQKGAYQLEVSFQGTKLLRKSIRLKGEVLKLTLDLEPLKSPGSESSNTPASSESSKQLDEVDITAVNDRAADKLLQVEGTAIYAGKKTEVINMKNINANLATNNARQIYARIAGLNIWEYDGGGLQLGIGGRGLNPSRVSNFNTRQNGYDISADALGYPESYYTPPTEALERIEIVRGAASLQYGTQFGGMINFKLKKGPVDKPFEITSRQTVGSFGFVNTFNSIGGTVKKLNYYAYYQYKKGDSWRPNSHFDQHGAYVHLDYAFSDKFKLTTEFTHMDYLAQQPGGLTDDQFNRDPSISVRARNWFKVNWDLLNVTLDYKISEQTKLNWRSYHLSAGRDALGILTYINRPDPGVGSPRDLMVDKYNNYGSELRLLHQYTLLNAQTSTLLTGVRVYSGLTKRQQGDANTGAGADFNFLTPEPNKSQFRFPGANVAVFAENIFQISDKWSVTPGARFEFISTKSDGYYYKIQRFVEDIRIDEQKKNNRSFVFFGIGTSYKPVPAVEVYANISQNYKSINFNDLRILNENARVDSLLHDEKGYTADMGIRGNLKDWLYYDLSVFYLKYNGRIGSVQKADPNNMLYRLRTNVSDSRNIGFESLVEADFLKLISQGSSKYKLSAYTNFSLIDARYINTQNTAFKDKKVEFVPPMLFRTGLSFGDQRFNLSLQYSYVAKHYSDATNAEITETAVDGAIPSYQVMDFSASYNWKWFTLYGSVNNLLDEKYFTRRADGYPGPGILPSDPRGYYLTLQFKL